MEGTVEVVYIGAEREEGVVTWEGSWALLQCSGTWMQEKPEWSEMVTAKFVVW